MLATKRKWDFENSNWNLFLPGDTEKQYAIERILVSLVKSGSARKGNAAGLSWGG